MTSKYLLKPARTLRQVCRQTGLSFSASQSCHDCRFAELCILDEVTMREVSIRTAMASGTNTQNAGRPPSGRGC